MSYTNPYQQRVQKGATLLDQRKPGWREEIDTERLDLSDVCMCVLGQSYDFYAQGVDSLFSYPLTEHMISHGFDFHGSDPSSDENFPILTAAWLSEIGNPTTISTQEIKAREGVTNRLSSYYTRARIGL